MDADADRTPVAPVTGIYRERGGDLDPLGPDEPLTLQEVRTMPIFYELELHPQKADRNLIIDILYDRISPMRLPDLMRGTDLPEGVRFWQDWFLIPPYQSLRDVDGRRVYPRAPGIHTVQIRTGVRKLGQMSRERAFRPENGGFESPVYRIRIAGE